MYHPTTILRSLTFGRLSLASLLAASLLSLSTGHAAPSGLPPVQHTAAGTSAAPQRLSARLDQLRAPHAVQTRIRYEDLASVLPARPAGLKRGAIASSPQRTPVFIAGDFVMPGANTPEAAARAFLSSLSQDFGIPRLGDVLTLSRTQTDARGMTHLRFTLGHQQTPVEGAMVMVHVDAKLHIRSLNGHLNPLNTAGISPNITADQALALATLTMEEELARADRPTLPPHALRLAQKGSPTLHWLVGRSSPDAQTQLAWKLELGSWKLWIDAQSGALLRRTLHLDAIGLETYTRNGNEYNTSVLVASEEPTYRSAAIDDEEEAAHGHANDFGLYLQDEFGRNSIDDDGYRLQMVVQDGNYANAYWDGYGTYFGVGWATRDIVAHEFTHGMTEFSAGLEYYAEAGALNESFSDVFGAMLDRDDWLMGEEASGMSIDNPVRDLQDPHKGDRFHPEEYYDADTNSGQPASYGERVTGSDPICYSTGDYYNECVHFNSGIQNRVAFLLSEGGEQNGVEVYGIGRADAEQIFFHTLTTRLTAYSDYQDARDNAVEAARELFGQNSLQHLSTQNAFAAVELGSAITYQDTDGDGMVDVWEEQYGLDPAVDDAAEDLDGDGLSNLAEYQAGTAPDQQDTDADGIDDGDEVAQGQDPRDAKDNRPTANAGSDVRLPAGTFVTLNGSGSSDPNSDALTYAWRFISVPTGSQLNDSVLSNSVQTSFLPDVGGTYVLGLKVSDGKAQSLEDTVSARLVRELRVPEDFGTLQAAIDAAEDGDLVSVGPGTYLERLDFQGKDLQVSSTDGAEFTVIDADFQGTAVSFVSGEPLTTTLAGFTIRHGDDNYGGGIFIYYSAATVRDCILEDNSAGNGGAIAVNQGQLELTGSTLASNTAYELGGAVMSDNGSNLMLVGNELRNNTASYDGGALWVQYTSGTLANNVIRENTQGDFDSAAVEVQYGSTLDLINNTFVDNLGVEVADVYVNDANTTLRNNLFAGASQGACFYSYYYGYGYGELAYNLFGSYPSGPILYKEDPSGTNGNISGDPLMVGYSNDGDPSNDDFSLSPLSPAIDAGDPAEEYLDLDGTRNDIGSTGGPTGVLSVDTDGDGMSDAWEIRYGLDPATDDGAEDLDGDGLTNLEEYTLHTNPSKVDSDADGIDDGTEVADGNDPRDPSDQRPTANAGEDSQTDVGTTLELEGSGTDPNGDALTYTWTLSQKPSDSQLADAELVNLGDGRVRFTPDVRGTFILSLSVHDGKVSSPADTVNVSALGVLQVPAGFTTIQSAIDAAFPNERIVVAPGTYLESLSIPKALRLESEKGPDVTLLSGQDSSRVLTIRSEGEVSVSGFTVRDGDEYYGGGLYLDGAAHLTDMQFRNNESYYYGGALYLDYLSTLLCERCLLEDNSSETGAATYQNFDSTLTFKDSVIRGNFSHASGVIYAYGGVIALERVQMLDNSSDYSGAIYASHATVTIVNSLFQANETNNTSSAAGAINLVDSTADIRNNTFAGNWGPTTGDVHCDGSQLTFQSNILAGGAPIALYSTEKQDIDLQYNDVFGYRIRYGGALSEQTGRNGNISEPARFVHYSRDGILANDNFHLTSSSPALNAGSPDASQQDPDGSRNDMGMYGGPGATF